MPEEPRRSNNQRLQPIRNTAIVGPARRQLQFTQERTTNQGPTHGNSSAGGNAPMRGGVGHLSNPQAQVHSTIIAPAHQNEETRVNNPARGGVGNPINQQENSTRIVSNHENNIGVNYPSMGGAGNPTKTQDNSTKIVSNYENNTGLNVPSSIVAIPPHTPQGHGANVVSTPENNTSTDASTVGPPNRAIHMARENPVAVIQPQIVSLNAPPPPPGAPRQRLMHNHVHDD
ncbi:hypothetical protein VPH35_123716 [Triticum aestivum]